MNKNSLNKWLGILIFRISTLEFGCDIGQIQIFDLANKYKTSDGKALFNGNDIPILELGESFGLSPALYDKKRELILYEAFDKLIGIKADEIKEVLPLDEKTLDNLLLMEDAVPDDRLIGKMNFEGRTILLPDFDKMIYQLCG